MSQAGYTPIQLYYSTTAAAVPVNTNLADGELAINITDGKLYYKDNGGTVRLLASNATSAPVLTFSAGTTGFTPSSATAGAITLAGTLATTNGGTGLTSFTSGGVVYSSSSSALATGSALVFDGTNLGVGVASPTKKLDILSNTSQDGIRISGSANPRLTIIDTTTPVQFDALCTDTEAVLRTDTNHPLVFSTNGTERMRLDTSGNLGLGVTPSAWDSTYKAIQVGARSMFYGIGSEANMANNAYYNAGYKYVATSAAGLYTIDANVHKWYSAASGTAGNTISFTQAMTLDASGNLSIGTTNALGILHVNGVQDGVSGKNARFSYSGTYYLEVNETSIRSFNNPLIFGSGTSGTERMRLDSSGNVGIGIGTKTFSLGKALEVGFAGNGINGASQTQVSFIGNAYYNGNWKYGGTGKAGFMQIDNGTILWYNTDTSGTADNNITGFSERARIDSSGNLLVGTTNAALNGRGVNSSVFKNLTTQDTLGLNQSSNTYFNLVSVVSTTSGTRYHVGFGDGNSSFAERGSISTNGTSTSYTTTSDYRLKENIQPMQNALAKVVALKPCTYTWKSNGSNGEGFIAHELQEVVPQCVSGEKDAENEDGKPKYQGVDTSFLVATLTAAIQEQQALIVALTARVEALEAK